MPLFLKYSVTCTLRVGWQEVNNQKKICAREGVVCPFRLVCARMHDIVKKKTKKKLQSWATEQNKEGGVKGGWDFPLPSRNAQQEQQHAACVERHGMDSLTTCAHTHSQKQSICCVCSPCTYVASSHLVNWWIQDTTESRCGPAWPRLCGSVLLKATCHLPRRPIPLYSPRPNALLLRSHCHPLKRKKTKNREMGAKCALTSPGVSDFPRGRVRLR